MAFSPKQLKFLLRNKFGCRKDTRLNDRLDGIRQTFQVKRAFEEVKEIATRDRWDVSCYIRDIRVKVKKTLSGAGRRGRRIRGPVKQLLRPIASPRFCPVPPWSFDRKFLLSYPWADRQDSMPPYLVSSKTSHSIVPGT